MGVDKAKEERRRLALHAVLTALSAETRPITGTLAGVSSVTDTRRRTSAYGSREAEIRMDAKPEGDAYERFDPPNDVAGLSMKPKRRRTLTAYLKS